MNRPVAVVGLGYGDEGKGATVDWLCATRKVGAVVRFNGGPQAGHNVLLPDGREHTFSQFGSGTFRGTPTFLGPRVAIRPDALAREARHLKEVGVPHPFGLIAADSRCLIVTPYHVARQELGDPVGSCGSGYGEAVVDAKHGAAVRLGMLMDSAPPQPFGVGEILTAQRRIAERRGCRELPGIEEAEAAIRWVADCVLPVHDTGGWLLRRQLEGPLIFEGAQGVLLDQTHGFHPYTTWSDCTFDGADELARLAHLVEPYRLGVLRAGMTTRHGPGPHVSESPGAPECPNEANGWNRHQGSFRVGWFDAVAHEYAARVTQPEGIALTQLDAAENETAYVASYVLEGRQFDRFPGMPADFDQRAWVSESLFVTRHLLATREERSWSDVVADATGCPVVLEAHGPHAQDRFASGPLREWASWPARDPEEAIAAGRLRADEA